MKLSHGLFLERILVCNHLLETTTSIRVMKVKFGHNKFGKKTVQFTYNNTFLEKAMRPS